VLTRTHYWYQHEPCWYVRKKNAPWFGKAGENSTVWDSASPKFIMGGSDEEKFDHPTQKPVDLMRRPILDHTKGGQLVYEPFLGKRDDPRGRGAHRARLLRHRARPDVRQR
jgi:DNA modification methylase